MNPPNVYNLRGYFTSYESAYKRMYICFTADEFTEKWLSKKVETSGLDYNPVHTNGYGRDQLPGFFIKYNGQSQFVLSSKDKRPCTMDDLKDKHVVIKVQYKTYNYKDKNGWNLTCLDMSADS